MKNVPIEGTERAWIEVDLGALRRNSRVISDRVGDGCRLLPMVKADAYGVGMDRVVHGLRPLRPWGFGVASTAEGRAVRRTGWDGPPNPEKLAMLAEDVDTLRGIVEGFPPRVREVFVLRKVFEMKQQEIAGQLGISESTVEKHIARGLLLLKQARNKVG